MSGLLINNLPPFLEGDIEPEPGCKLFLSGKFTLVGKFISRKIVLFVDLFPNEILSIFLI